MTYLSPQGNQTLIVVVPVFNSTRGSGYEPLPAEEEDPLGGLYFCLSLTGKLGAIHDLKKPNKFIVNSSSRCRFRASSIFAPRFLQNRQNYLALFNWD